MDVDELRNHPKNNSNFFSNVLFLWTFDIFKIGAERNIQLLDLYTVLDEHKSEEIHRKIIHTWDKEKNRSKPSLFKAIFWCFKLDIFLTILLAALRECLVRPLQAVFLGYLISLYETDNYSNYDVYFYIICILICSLITVLLSHPVAMMVSHLGLKYRIALTALIMDKALKLSLESLHKTTVGQIVNLLSNDLRRFDMGTVLLNYLIVSPIQLIIISYFLWTETKIASLLGLSFFIAIIPLQYWVGKKISSIRFRSALLTDKRLMLITELVNAIHQIKMFVWEEVFIGKINLVRKQEINQIKKLSYLKGLVACSSMFVTRVALFIILFYYAMQGNQITATKVFVTVCFYEILKQTLIVWFLSAINQLIELFVTLKRIQSFLLLPEKEIHVELNCDKEFSIKLTDVTLRRNENICLNNVSMEISDKSFTVIVGEVGCGKTSLLQIMAGEITPNSGEAITNGKISYNSQNPSLFEGTIRENIVFHNKYDEERYNVIIKYCHLDYDFSNFADGDSTLINNNNSPLSGGQKSRIDLARCLYHRADIYLFDNPLAAIDENVGKQIYKNVFHTFLKDKTRILITNDLKYINGSENILMLKDGKLERLTNEINVEMDIFQNQSIVENSNMKPNTNNFNMLTKSIASNKPVTYKTYLHYYHSGNSYIVLLFLILVFIAAQILVSESDFWLKVWSDYNTASHKSASELEYINYSIIYMILIISLVLLLIGRSIFFYWASMRSSLKLHKTMLIELVNSKLWIFHLSSLGEILNRFSQDIGSVDDLLPLVSLDSYQIVLATLGIFFIILFTNGFFMIFIFSGTFFILFYLRNYYLKTARNLTRLESEVRSPVFSHLSSTLQSLITIRSMNAEAFMARRMHFLQNIYSTVSYLSIGTSRAFALWLDIICIILIAVVSLSFPILYNESSAGNVGLAITQIIGLMTILQWGVRQTSVMENQMTAIERITQYDNNEQDGSEIIPSDMKQTSLIDRIQFKNISFRYQPNQIEILNDVSFEVSRNEKILIMGRTGSGKSSTINALFKFGHVEGEILINGVNYKNIQTHKLRRMISVVPQEPVVYSGTVRENLDPLYESSDDQIWKSLEQVQLKSTVSALPDGLQEMISNNSLSIGEKQLLCLARAILKENKVLILDEATSMIDKKTDSSIQTILKECFSDCIVIVIAHRVTSLAAFDKVLIMNDGRAVEFDEPNSLLRNKNSLLWKLYENDLPSPKFVTTKIM